MEAFEPIAGIYLLRDTVETQRTLRLHGQGSLPFELVEQAPRFRLLRASCGLVLYATTSLRSSLSDCCKGLLKGCSATSACAASRRSRPSSISRSAWCRLRARPRAHTAGAPARPRHQRIWTLYLDYAPRRLSAHSSSTWADRISESTRPSTRRSSPLSRGGRGPTAARSVSLSARCMLASCEPTSQTPRTATNAAGSSLAPPPRRA